MSKLPDGQSGGSASHWIQGGRGRTLDHQGESVVASTGFAKGSDGALFHAEVRETEPVNRKGRQAMNHVGQQQSGDNSNRRDLERQTLLYRTAKIRMVDREFLCLLHNVSTTGFSIRTFGKANIESSCMLELANGEAYNARRVWQDASNAGFEFEEAVDVREFIAPSNKFDSRQIRLNSNGTVLINTDRVRKTVELVDISIGGAKLRGLNGLWVGEIIRLELDGIGCLDANVRWLNQKYVGIMFQTPLRFDQLARWSLL